MANKREFKKFVTAVGSNVCEDILINTHCCPGIDAKIANDSILRILTAVETATGNANVRFDKGEKAFENRREYTRAKEAFFRQLFNKINADFAQELDEAVKEFNAAVPEKVRKQNAEQAK